MPRRISDVSAAVDRRQSTTLLSSAMNLLLLEPDEVGSDHLVRLSDVRAGHLLEVLKVNPGDRLRIGIVDGPLGDAVVTAVDAGSVVLRCEPESDVPPRPGVDLLLALPRPKVLRRLWAPFAALGVGRIVLTNAARVERPYFDTHVITETCYRPLLIEGLQQARDTRVPIVSVHRRFRTFVEDDLDEVFGAGLRLVAHPGSAAPVAGAVRQHGADRVTLAIGPEGGWSGFELELLEAHAFRRVSMGSRTLRTDTAAIALLALAHEALRAAPAHHSSP